MRIFLRNFLFLFSICFPAASWAGEEESSFSGTLGQERVILTGLLRGMGCSDLKIGEAGEVKKINASSAKIVLYKDFDRKIVLKEYEATRSVEKYKGVLMEVYVAPSVKYKNKLFDLVLRRSLQNGLLTWAQEDGDCPDAGWSPGQIRVVFDPDKKKALLAWAKVNHATLSEIRPYPDAKNFFVLNVPVGMEYKLIANLKNQVWVLDVRREGEEAGPESGMLELNPNTLYAQHVTQAEMSNRLVASLQKVFPNVPIGYESLKPIRGFSYKLPLLTPANKLGLNDPNYDGYWLKADVVINVTRELDSQDKPFERIEVAIDDGWLPRWPDNEAKPPPDRHIKQAHLAPDDQSTTKNFDILKKLIERVANELAKDFNGSFNSRY